ncbi:fumarylacetoacetate hydrolase family protein [Brevibacillus fulvus]|uniref:2-keto-4-pentenoate hydratase/2-oxohepta-3-ene-1,7-dioic acid hydratase in catechol pathway n=1 Tax=Brevibacillus fulvus TaxID=1125967 RepID=A0A938Y112_9BACL|nr:fumarylacetoacetate hydrolase family protein [Brevibacillus fulvus]MBM7589617.1 2-keto-4-pentenoate hydratase/2-oxohepta-3-ene-1,7-dioic acid hydratase in catechol pathway [Brevibacillus fulvus]
MRSVTFIKDQQTRLGIKTERGILDVERAMQRYSRYSLAPASTKRLIAADEQERQALQGLIQTALETEDADFFYREEELVFGPCVDQPEKILCIGLNYRKHAEESNMAIPQEPIVFSKFHNALSAHQQPIVIPTLARQVDYEAELVIVMQKQAKNVAKEEALSYVYGYCAGNDVSARDLQFKSSQWLLGKTSDGFCPIGPYLVSKEEIPDPNRLRIMTRVNQEVRQDSNTADMIFSCAEIVAYLSQYMTLQPGDLIMTGTPEGVIMGQAPEQQRWLSPGDVVEVEIEGLGTLTNSFCSEQTSTVALPSGMEGERAR